MLVDLSEKVKEISEGHTSKGNQPKWHSGDWWYKADHMGYEALSEVLVSRLLAYSGVNSYVSYEPVTIRDESGVFTGCRSRNFKQCDEMLVPLERLYRAYCGQSLAKKLAAFKEAEERIRFTTEFVESVTKITDFGQYLSVLLELDAFTLNEDRHTNNIAVLRNEETGKYRLCPVFDNGLAFLSDVKDYPVGKDMYENIARVEAKPFSCDFMEQMEAAANLYGGRLHFDITRREVDSLFDGLEEYYSSEILDRVRSLLFEQMRKFQYLFRRDEF